MSISALVAILPNYAHDLKVNLTNTFKSSPDGLTNEQLFGAALTASLLIGNEKIYNLVRKDAKMHLENEYISATKDAAMLMALYNTYHFFSHNQSDEEIINSDPNFESSSLTEHGLDHVDFEIFLLIASIINKCEYCVDYHTTRLQKKGISNIALIELAKVASVLKASADVLQMENLRSYDFMASESNF